MRMDDLYVEPALQPISKGALADKIALVTGASRGIGAVTARVLARAGAQVILNYRNKGARAEKVAAEIEAAGGNASTIQCDITVSQKVDSMLDEIRRAMIPQLATRKIALIVVSGDMIEGTITPKLLTRTNRGLIEFRREQAGRLPTVEEFGQAIAEAVADPHLQSGATVYVGGTD